MKHQYFSADRFLIFSILFFVCALTAKAQSFVPDEQLLREMTLYARHAQREVNLSRPRIINAAETTEKSSKTISESVRKPAPEISVLEHTAFDWLNQKRAAQGLPPLKWNEEIAKVARYHSDDMARGRYFSHKQANGSMVNDRADLFGMSDWQSIGENIAFNRGFKLPAESACQQWMNSASHRENVLDKRWKEAGIGVAVGDDGSYYFTQVFILR